MLRGMGEISDIEDHDSLKTWLEDQPREVAVWIASRAAARVLSIWWHGVLTEGWAREGDLTALPVLRCLLISSVAAKVPTEDMRAAAVAANAAIYHATYTDATHSATHSATIYAAAYAAAAAGDDATYAAATLAAAARAAVDARETVRTDAEQVQGGVFPDHAPLWPGAGGAGAGPLGETWHMVRTLAPDHDPDGLWTFWIDWYQALLDGRPLLGDAARTWEMLEEIGLIEPEVWDEGPTVVAAKIREIWELYRLRVEAAALRAEKEALLATCATPEQRSHNQPPGLVGGEPEIARQVTIIWDGLDEAQAELEQEAPDKGRLRAIGERILAAVKAVAGYCGKVGSAFIIGAAAAGGAKAGPDLYDYIANNERLMQFAKDLLGFAIGG